MFYVNILERSSIVMTDLGIPIVETMFWAIRPKPMLLMCNLEVKELEGSTVLTSIVLAAIAAWR